MKSEFDGSDYYIHITPEEGRKISSPINKKQGKNYLPFIYDWLESQIESEFLPDAFLMLRCTNGSRTANFPGRITLNREDEDNPQDIIVRVFTGEMLNLLDRRIPYIMTRYDRVENKIWLFLEN